MSTTLTYDTVSRNILEDSISSAIFIDDKALESFKSKNYTQNYVEEHNRTIALYEDFKSKNCLLHSFKFTKSGWKKNKEFYLKNKDLLILDWQLVDTDHGEALKILDEAIKRKSLHFACIYTQENSEDVKRELNRFFWGKVNTDIITEYRALFNGTDLENFWEIDKNEPEWRELESLIDNIVNANDLSNEEQEFIERYSLDEEISNRIKELVPHNINASYQKLKTILSQDSEDLIFSSFNDATSYQNSADDITLYINHTIVKIFGKNIKGDNLYDNFLQSLLKEHNVFLTLMGLEMRNRFRDNSAFIGKDFDNISEEAFFFHKNNNSHSDYLFTEFLINVLKDQVASFLYEDDLEIFRVLNNYYDNNGGKEKQNDFLAEKNKFYKDTYYLNYFYNKLNIEERNKIDFVRFGDIFKTSIPKQNRNGETIEEERYFICITPHCDCLNPKKIEFQYWFVEGKLSGKKNKHKESVLDKTDGKYLSFVKIDDNIEAIQWENSSITLKPKTFNIRDNKIKKGIVKGKYNNQDIQLTLIDTLKENYAQRIANKAFGYPLRVGIDFVKKS